MHTPQTHSQHTKVRIKFDYINCRYVDAMQVQFWQKINKIVVPISTPTHTPKHTTKLNLPDTDVNVIKQ